MSVTYASTSCAARGHTVRQTDGATGVAYAVRAIHLPSGAIISGEEVASLHKTVKGRAKLERMLSQVRVHRVITLNL
jgi:hypothetical protein